VSSGGAAADGRAPIGRVVTLGAFILDVLGRPVESIPPGQGSVLLQEIRATAAGTAAGPAVDLAKLGAQVSAVGALGEDVIADIIVAILRGHGIDTAGLVRRPGLQTAATMLTGLGSDAGITSLADTVGFLRRAEPGPAARIEARIAAGSGRAARTVPA
jgi:sugar/nucleoside kinase (ribokinase family)